MGYVEKRLASGQIAAALTTVYTVPGVTTGLLTQLWVYNTGGTVQTVTVAINDGTDRTIATVELDTGEYAIVELRGMVLNTGDLVKLQTTSATTVNYVLSGVEKT